MHVKYDITMNAKLGDTTMQMKDDIIFSDNTRSFQVVIDEVENLIGPIDEGARWWNMRSVAVQASLAATLVDDAPHMLHAWEGSAPPLGILLHGEAPAESRLHLR